MKEGDCDDAGNGEGGGNTNFDVAATGCCWWLLLFVNSSFSSTFLLSVAVERPLRSDGNKGIICAQPWNVVLDTSIPQEGERAREREGERIKSMGTSGGIKLSSSSSSLYHHHHLLMEEDEPP